MKKKLSLQEAVQAGQIVYTMNTEREASLVFARSAGFFDEVVDIARKSVVESRKKSTVDSSVESAQNSSYESALFADAQEHFLWEWRAFVHSAVLHGLSECAPAVVVVEYLRGVQELLKSQDSSIDAAMGNRFVDEPFQAYTTAVLEKRLSACPQIFFKRYLDIDLDASKKNGTGKSVAEQSALEQNGTGKSEVNKNETGMDTAPINTTYTPCIAAVSGAMAMLFAASLDTFEKYEYALD